MIAIKGGITPLQRIDKLLLHAEYLNRLSFNWRLKGTMYLYEVLEWISKEKGGFFDRFATKEVLPTIAKAHATDWRAVERAIRYAIEDAWLRADPDIIIEFFPFEFPKTGRPSVYQFICHLGHRMLREMDNDLTDLGK